MGTLCIKRAFYYIPTETDRIKPYTRAIENDSLDEWYRLRDIRKNKKKGGS